MQIRGIADFLLKSLQQSNRLDREADVRGMRELMPYAARITARRSGPEHGLALDEHDVGDAETSQVIRHARAHTSAADDDDVGGALHTGAYQMTLTDPDSRMGPSRVTNGRFRSRAVATINASKGSRVNRNSSARSTCAGVMSSG